MGSNPLVSRFMKGVFNERPPKPRYQEIWDVKPVLNYLCKLSPVKLISLKQLTLKLCMLLALVSAQSAQTLSLISLDNMIVRGSNIKFVVDELVKQSRPGNVGHVIELEAYPPDRRLCVKTVLSEYISRTKSLRETERKFFVSYKAPHGKVSKDTIARWVRMVLSLAGVDTAMFKSHSTRAAATSAASVKFVPVSDIITTAGWSNEKTFQTFYKKPIKPVNQFPQAVLQA